MLKIDESSIRNAFFVVAPGRNAISQIRSIFTKHCKKHGLMTETQWKILELTRVPNVHNDSSNLSQASWRIHAATCVQFEIKCQISSGIGTSDAVNARCSRPNRNLRHSRNWAQSFKKWSPRSAAAPWPCQNSLMFTQKQKELVDLVSRFTSTSSKWR